MAERDGVAAVNGSAGGEQWPVRLTRSRLPWTKTLTRIKVVGVGDGGCKFVLRMSKHEVPGVQYVMVNTGLKPREPVLNMAEVVQIGQRRFGDWSQEGSSRISELNLEESDFHLRNVLEDAELVLVTAGMGGATGTGAAPYVGTLARETGAFVLGMVTTPFSFEGSRRTGEAVAGVARLRPCVDNLIVIHSDRLLRYVDADVEIVEAFRKADEVMIQGLLSISELLNDPGELNVDFADVRAILGLPGGTLMSVGLGYGEMGAVDAAQQAIAYPLINLSLASARGILFSVRGGQAVTPSRVDEAGSLIAASARTKPRVMFGVSMDDTLEDEVQLTLIATGL